MNMDEKKIPEFPSPEHSQLSSQEQITDEELEQVSGGRLRWCAFCGAPKNNPGGACPNKSCSSNQ